MSFVTRNRTEFTDILDLDWRVDIEEDSFAGSLTPMQATGEPLKITFLTNGDNILESPIKGSTAEISVYSDTNFEWIGLTSIYDLQYRVSIYYDATLYWRGFLTPGQYREPYDGTSYPVVFTANDGLGFLKNISYTSDGTPVGTAYSGRLYASQIILDILAKIQAIEFMEFANIYEATMLSTIDDSPLDQMKLDADLFLGKNCYEVLETILKTFDAAIRQINGVYIIYRPTELINATVYGRYFTGATTKTSVSFSPVQFISRYPNYTNLRDIEGGTLMNQQQASQVTINYDIGNKASWIDNYQFEAETFTNSGILDYTVDKWTKSAGTVLNTLILAAPGETEGVMIACQNTYPALDYNISQIFGTDAVVSTTDKIYIDFDFLLYNASVTNQTGEQIYVEIKSNTASWYLYAIDDMVAAWQTTPTYFDITVDAPVGSTGWINFKRQVTGLPTIGSYTVTLYAINDAYPQVYVGFRNFKFYAVSEKVTILFTKAPQSGWSPLPWKQFGKPAWYPSEVILTDRTIAQKKFTKYNSNNGIAISADIILGDCSDVLIDNAIEQFQGSITIDTGSLSLSTLWSTRGIGENLSIGQLICNEIAYQYARVKQLINLPIMEDDTDGNTPSINLLGTFTDTLNTIGGLARTFVFNQGSFNVRDRVWSIDIIELIPPAGAYVPPAVSYSGYGALYNWFAVDTGLLAPADWYIPTLSEWQALITYLTSPLAGGKLKETGTTHWNSPNTGASNETGFTAIGTGLRLADGTFANISVETHYWASNQMDATNGYIAYLVNNSAAMFSGGNTKSIGNPVRCFKNSTTLSDGQTGTVTDIDGNVYSTVCINGTEIMAVNLNVTKYNDGTPIPVVVVDAAWAALSTGAMCWYPDDSVFVRSPTKINCSKSGETVTVSITCGAAISWTASTEYTDWISISGGGPNTGSGTFDATFDATISPQYGSIDITSDIGDFVIIVNQILP